MTSVDAYNLAQSLTLDDLEDFTDAFLVLVGMGGTTPEDAKELRRNKILSLYGDGARAEWLIKNINDTYVENVINAPADRHSQIQQHTRHERRKFCEQHVGRRD